MLVIKADHKQYSALIASLKNQHNQNIQGYPINSQQAYQMLVDYVPTSNLMSQHDNDGGGIAYLQHDNDRTTNDSSCGSSRTGHGGGRSSGHGGQGGCTGGQGASKSSHFSKSIPNDGEVSEPYFVFVVYDMQSGELFISQKRPQALPDTWLLIDSCSTIDIISSPGLLHGIHKVSTPIQICCNAGVTILDQMGFLGDYPRPVWFNPHSGANIMSMFNISQLYHLSMNT